MPENAEKLYVFVHYSICDGYNIKFYCKFKMVAVQFATYISPLWNTLQMNRICFTVVDVKQLCMSNNHRSIAGYVTLQHGCHSEFYFAHYIIYTI